MKLRAEARKLNEKKGATRGFATLFIELEEGVEFRINDFSILEGSEGLFVSEPKRSYVDEETGETKYAKRVSLIAEDTEIYKAKNNEYKQVILDVYNAL